MQIFINIFDYLSKYYLIFHKANIHECKKDQVGLEKYYTKDNDYDNDHEFWTKTDCLHSCTVTFIILVHQSYNYNI